MHVGYQIAYNKYYNSPTITIYNNNGGIIDDVDIRIEGLCCHQEHFIKKLYQIIIRYNINVYAHLRSWSVTNGSTNKRDGGIDSSVVTRLYMRE